MLRKFEIFRKFNMLHKSDISQKFDTSRKLTALLGLCLCLTACSKVDDYLLGADNTPSPKNLSPIQAKAKVQEKWSRPTGFTKKNSAYLKLKPVVIGKTVFAADASGVVQAIDTKDGHLIWSKKLNAGVISGPTLALGYLVLGTDSSKLVALKQSTGEELWQASLSGDALAKPVISGNKVISKTIDGNLYAFELTSGKKMWLSEHGAPSLILKASSSPVVIGNRILVGYSDGKMDVLDSNTGMVISQHSIAFATGASDVERLVDIDADPIVQGDVAYLASYQGYVGALSLSTGQFLWRKPASTYTNLVIHGGSLYMVDSNDTVWSFNKLTGQVNWKQTALKARGLTEPSLLNNRLVIGDKTGMLHLLSTQSGELLARSQVGGSISIAAGISGNSAYVMSANGKLTRFSVSA